MGFIVIYSRSSAKLIAAEKNDTSVINAAEEEVIEMLFTRFIEKNHHIIH